MRGVCTWRQETKIPAPQGNRYNANSPLCKSLQAMEPGELYIWMSYIGAKRIDPARSFYKMLADRAFTGHIQASGTIFQGVY